MQEEIGRADSIGPIQKGPNSVDFEGGGYETVETGTQAREGPLAKYAALESRPPPRHHAVQERQSSLSLHFSRKLDAGMLAV